MENIHIIKASESVLAIANLKFEGVTAIPDTWYENITNKAGSADLLAIVLLSEIVYWHKLMPIYEENNLIGYAQKFAGKKLQKQTSDFSKKYKFSEKSVNEALNRLVDLSLITREFADVRKGDLIIQKRQFIDIVPAKIIKISSLEVSTKGKEGVNESYLRVSTKGKEGINESYSYTKTTDTKTTYKEGEAKKIEIIERDNKYYSEMLAYFGQPDNEQTHLRIRQAIRDVGKQLNIESDLEDYVFSQFKAYVGFKKENGTKLHETTQAFIFALSDNDYRAKVKNLSVAKKTESENGGLVFENNIASNGRQVIMPNGKKMYV